MFKSVAIITGASQGIGQASAIRLARDFSALVLVARNRANLEQTAETVRTAGAEALVIDADLAQPEAALAVVDRQHRSGGLFRLRSDARRHPRRGTPQLASGSIGGNSPVRVHGRELLTREG